MSRPERQLQEVQAERDRLLIALGNQRRLLEDLALNKDRESDDPLKHFGWWAQSRLNELRALAAPDKGAATQ